MSDASATESFLTESRRFPPPAGFAASALVQGPDHYQRLHAASLSEPEAFWSDVANQLHWFRPYDRVLNDAGPDSTWFVNGKINACFNALDRQISAGLGDHLALVWEAEPVGADGKPEIVELTYRDLLARVSRFANALKARGVKKGDVVTIYMGMVPELAVAVLACARIGAVHSVIFGGFSAQAIRDRVEDGKSRIVVTCDGSWRRGKVVPLKDNVDQALTMTERVKDVIVFKRCGNDVAWHDGRDHDWTALCDAADADCPAEPMDSEDLLFILYTSGSTGKPKGIMHTTGGYLAHSYLTTRLSFDVRGHGEAPRSADHPRPADLKDRPWDPGPVDPSIHTDQRYWCTADVGWITGHSYILYGPLMNRVPTLMYEGAPNHPGPDRFWDIVARHKITTFYTAPTAIRAFMKWGDEHPAKQDLSSLRVLGTVGEPINPEAWVWYHEQIGGGRCPIVDTWWQTETGGHMLTPLPGATTTTPGSCCTPMLGVDAAVVNSDGEEVATNAGGILVVRKPWPGMLRGIYGDRERFLETYWQKVPGMYCPADGARVDEDGNFWITGRIDDVIVVAGHNLGTMEVESALVSHPAVAEAAVVGFPHEVKGTGVAAFVITQGDLPEPGGDEAEALKRDLIAHCGQELGPIAKPDQIRLTAALPKTRSGKIMRRLLRDIAAGRPITSDTTTLEDRGIVEQLQRG